MVEVTDMPTQAFTEEIEVTAYSPSAATSVFIEDMKKAICHIDKCEYKMDACVHNRLATDLMKAMLDHYSALLDRKGQCEAAKILRSEM